jgi:hypothetical protein
MLAALDLARIAGISGSAMFKEPDQFGSTIASVASYCVGTHLTRRFGAARYS